MSDMHLAPFSPSLGSALAKALTQAQYREIDSPYLGTNQTRGRPRSRLGEDVAVPTNLQNTVDSMTMNTNVNPRSNMPTGQREFELGNRVGGSLSASNRLIQERNRSPISNISRDVGSAARRGMDRAASSLAPMADAARQRFSDAGQSMRQGAQAAGQAMSRGAMNVASKIPGMARAAGRMVGTAGRKIGEAATSPKMKNYAARAKEGVGQAKRGASNLAMGLGTNLKNTAGAMTGAGIEYGAEGTRRLMGLNNPMGRQQQPSGSGGMPFGNNKTSESEAPSGGGENEGYTPSKEMMDDLYQQNIDRSQTRGGIGTGIVSNLLTGGLSGLARGAYNMRQRNIGRQNLQNLRQYGADAVPFLRSEYETMDDRSIIRSRMTTEAIRNAYVF
jgi:hypothetical protein